MFVACCCSNTEKKVAKSRLVGAKEVATGSQLVAWYASSFNWAYQIRTTKELKILEVCYPSSLDLHLHILRCGTSSLEPVANLGVLESLSRHILLQPYRVYSSCRIAVEGSCGLVDSFKDLVGRYKLSSRCKGFPPSLQLRLYEGPDFR